jgi:hypothetical protein
VGTNATLVAQAKIPAYLCPSNGNTPPDPSGFGLTDYMPIAYTDLDGCGGRNKLQVWAIPSSSGCATDYGGDIDSLLGFHNTIAASTDGTSNTIAIIEASGRTATVYSTDYSWGSVFQGSSPNGIAAGASGTTSFTTANCTSTSGGCVTSNSSTPGRWADPDSGSGVSGQNANRGQVINGNKTPTGGPSSCPWNTQTNCGPNDEPFSLHTGGCHALFGDGTVRFLSENMSVYTLRNLCGRAEGLVPGDF